MICPVSTRKSDSSWLDRLRTAKGFPEISATGLENFIQHLDSPYPEGSGPSPKSDAICDPNGGEDKELFTVMSDVLNELFNFGENCNSAAKLKKKARKQENPRICAFSNNGSGENNAAGSEKAMVSGSGDRNIKLDGVKALDRRENEGDEEDVNLSGFSRTEVAVIDTSYEVWKFERLLFRKKNVWKVRDKKGKSPNLGSKKKRKVNGGAEEDQCNGKKQKVDEEKGRGDKCELQLNQDMSTTQVKAPEEVGKILKKKHAYL